jgi:hypothetical protein
MSPRRREPKNLLPSPFGKKTYSTAMRLQQVTAPKRPNAETHVDDLADSQATVKRLCNAVCLSTSTCMFFTDCNIPEGLDEDCERRQHIL